MDALPEVSGVVGGEESREGGGEGVPRLKEEWEAREGWGWREEAIGGRDGVGGEGRDYEGVPGG